MIDALTGQGGDRRADYPVTQFNIGKLTEWVWRGILAAMVYYTVQNTLAVERYSVTEEQFDSFIAEQRVMNLSQVEINSRLEQIVAGHDRDVDDLNADIDRLRRRLEDGG
jgi:ubiquinone biosynthesis protein UbiJ